MYVSCVQDFFRIIALVIPESHNTWMLSKRIVRYERRVLPTSEHGHLHTYSACILYICMDKYVCDMYLSHSWRQYCIVQDASDYQFNASQITTRSLKPATCNVIMRIGLRYKKSILLCCFL